MTRIDGFPPLLGREPRVLILGSAPSVASLEKGQYYGKAQNAFWKIMGELFGAGTDKPYEERVRVLTGAGIAVWDVLGSCVRPGSLDSAIDMSTAEVNPIAELLTEQQSITHVFCNGRKSEEVFVKRVVPELPANHTELLVACLPSTSPAMAALSFTQKLNRWAAVKHAIDGA